MVVLKAGFSSRYCATLDGGQHSQKGFVSPTYLLTSAQKQTGVTIVVHAKLLKSAQKFAVVLCCSRLTHSCC